MNRIPHGNEQKKHSIFIHNFSGSPHWCSFIAVHCENWQVGSSNQHKMIKDDIFIDNVSGGPENFNVFAVDT